MEPQTGFTAGGALVVTEQMVCLVTHYRQKEIVLSRYKSEVTSDHGYLSVLTNKTKIIFQLSFLWFIPRIASITLPQRTHTACNALQIK